MINAERIANRIAHNGHEGILIHRLPNGPFWLVAEKTKKSSPNWRITVCDPEKTTQRLVSESVSDEEHSQLFLELLNVHVSSRMRDAVLTLKKHTASYKEHIYEPEQPNRNDLPGCSHGCPRCCTRHCSFKAGKQPYDHASNASGTSRRRRKGTRHPCT